MLTVTIKFSTEAGAGQTWNRSISQ